VNELDQSMSMTLSHLIASNRGSADAGESFSTASKMV
jgi:hypothetical protein